jgi:hypothetical protein
VTGFIFGRPQLSAPVPSPSNKRKATEYDMDHRVNSSQRSRPATGSTSTTPTRAEAQNSPSFPISTSKETRLQNCKEPGNEDNGSHGIQLDSTPRRRETMSPQDHSSGNRGDLFSARRNSWIRRLSTIQISSQGSPRSSVSPDSPSLTFSHGSTAPIMNSTGSPASLPPNKLVKRSTSVRVSGRETPTKGGIKSHMPTLRRPATSHQRSVTLQQQSTRDEYESAKVFPEQRSSSAPQPHRIIIGNFPLPESSTSWQPYFKSRPAKLTKERPSVRSVDGSTDNFYPTSRRIVLPEFSTPPTLMKAAMITDADKESIPIWMESLATTDVEANEGITTSEIENPPIGQLLNEEPDKRPRRSLSMPLTSPSIWVSRSGSLRALKRGTNAKNGKRYASDPLTSMPGRATIPAHGTYGTRRKGIMDPGIYENSSHEPDGHDLARSLSHTQKSSSSSPPLSRLSSFNLDLMRMGHSSSSSSAQPQSPASRTSPANPISISSGIGNDRPNVKSSSRVVIHQIRSPHMPELTGSDRASTLVGSDSENRGATSGEDDDTDFQSDTVFDSYRTGTSGSQRTRGSPLESMFDDSPPNYGHKGNTSIIRDMTTNGAFRDSIVEEDEGMVTPIKYSTNLDKNKYHTPVRDSIDTLSDEAMRSSPPSLAIGAKEFAQLSLEDDEEDEDWTKDDDILAISNPLSPPSSSVNSRRVSPAIRTALADVIKPGSSTGNGADGDDRQRSLFDWSEPLSVEQSDPLGNFPRPKTVHGKQILDHRGGRTVGRRGPTALHIRSQSVPVVPDVAGHREHRKLAPKFGTWGLGGKGVNEDWDNDFEFDGLDMDETDNGNDTMNGSGMLVPPAIQASQASVVGHVGQIREVCLLVEDLKRLRGLAREKGLLDGPSSALWREAEGIIALAIPDEEDEVLSTPLSPTSFNFDDEVVSDSNHDGGLDIDELSEEKDTSQGLNRHVQIGGPMRDGVQMRRRSVFSPEDDIFGVGGIAAAQRLGEEQVQSMKSTRRSHNKGSTDVARSVMEHIHQHRAISDPLRRETEETSKKMPFDTTSLRDLVHRANALTRLLADIIRKADNANQSPIQSPQTERDSSPAFTRVFADPLTNPPNHLPRSQSNNSMLGGSIDGSPTRRLEKRLHMMTVA